MANYFYGALQNLVHAAQEAAQEAVYAVQGIVQGQQHQAQGQRTQRAPPNPNLIPIAAGDPDAQGFVDVVADMQLTDQIIPAHNKPPDILINPVDAGAGAVEGDIDPPNPPLPPAPAPRVRGAVPPPPRRGGRQHIHADERSAWLASEPRWKHRIGKAWVGKKVLGQGGQGIVGHWTYEGADRASRSVRDVAVKQALRNAGRGLYDEAKIAVILAQAKSPHLLRMYRQLFEEKGQHTLSLDVGVVHRIFWEFCPGGDCEDSRVHLCWFLPRWSSSSDTSTPNIAASRVDAIAYNYIRKGKFMEEEMLWAIFHCLARAALVIHHGSEDATLPRWATREIVHFDIKKLNVLATGDQMDIEHRNRPIFKMADFGLAQQVPEIKAQTEAWMDRRKSYGTQPWLLPEQVKTNGRLPVSFGGLSRPWVTMFSYDVRRRFYGSPSNIWQIGLVMHCLMRQLVEHKWTAPGAKTFARHTSKLSHRLQHTTGPTLMTGEDLADERASTRARYSRSLRSTIAECLVIEPDQRRTPQELVRITGEALDRFNMNKGFMLGGDALVPWQEPQLSTQWEPPKAAPAENPLVPPHHAAAALAAQAPAPPPAPPPDVAPPLPLLQAQPQPQPQAQNQTQPPALRFPLAPGLAARAPDPGPIPPALHPVNQLRVIVTTHNILGARTTNIYTLTNLNSHMSIWHVKNVLNAQECGLTAGEMIMTYGAGNLMANHRKIGEFDLGRAGTLYVEKRVAGVKDGGGKAGPRYEVDRWVEKGKGRVGFGLNFGAFW